jgi:hypothetical protein
MSPITYIDYPLDKNQLLIEAQSAKMHAEPYGNDPRYPNQEFKEWLISKHTSTYIEQIMYDFNIEGKPRFYWLAPNVVLPEHVDYNTECALNFVLSDNPAPVLFQGKEYTYTAALLNTQIPHSVVNSNEERILFKISVFNESYEELAKRIKYVRR